jgi:hypothetical protein
VTLVRDMSKVLEYLSMSPIPVMAYDILGVVDVTLEHVKEAYNSCHDS